MYNVMLVDDDFPVLELLSEAIDWERLGLRLVGAHENGLNAWEQAQRQMPDILITDIGMPRMDGLELIARIRERKANVRMAILSCHSEFQYAQQAMRLNVQDYLLKDALNPAELERLLAQFKSSLDQERQSSWQQSQMQQLVQGTKELQIEKWVRNLIQQPLLSPEQMKHEAQALGLLREGEACLPAVGFIENYRQAKLRFQSDQTLRFAVLNVIEEVLQSAPVQGLKVGYDVKETFLLFTYKPSLKTNIYDQAAQSLKAVQAALNSALKLQMSFIMEESSASLEQLKQRLASLKDSAHQRFYLKEGSVVKRQAPVKRSGDLFSYYDQASGDFREVLLSKQPEAIDAVVEQWAGVVQSDEFAPEAVKDWVLKLLLDLRLKLQSLQLLRPGLSAETLHKEIVNIDSLAQLKLWLAEHMKALVTLAGKGAGTTVRSEVMEACQYVSLHLDRRISLEEVAESLHLNPSYFSRLFKKETGESFIEYVTRMKMERAKELLDQTGHSVGRICEELGYDNQSYFIKIFKAHTGVTPAEYRG
ncbi:helix-turn-helix domain-containing protein [Paenibacillus chartarius]|uniref:Helix-turn-helix domain-containing protein n=1 Tax=Paenibacillus chartarius TaxID=747481 RepID=A0ABV6DS26_9BACL